MELGVSCNIYSTAPSGKGGDVTPESEPSAQDIVDFPDKPFGCPIIKDKMFRWSSDIKLYENPNGEFP